MLSTEFNKLAKIFELCVIAME